MRRLLIPASCLLLAAAAPSNPTVTAAVSGITAARGRVHVDICTPKSFTREGCPYSASAAATAGTTVVTVSNVAPGRYAAQAYWDENGNGKADRNFLGLPLELVGFTNIAKVGMSRPKFEQAAFDQPATGARITIVVRKIP